MGPWSEACPWRSAFDDALRGDVESLVSLRDASRAESRDRAWVEAAGALLWFADVPGCAPPTLAALDHPNDGNLAPLAYAASRVAKAAFLSFDRQQVEATRSWFTRARAESSEPVVGLWAELVGAWALLLAGSPIDVAALERTRQEAIGLKRSELAVEATIARAMALSASGELERALADARAASREASCERLPQQVYFANAVLARIRRIGGRWYLATRILASLLRSASAPWRAWLSWELALAQGDVPVAVGPAATLAFALRATATGEPSTYRAHMGSLERDVHHIPQLAEDVRAVRAAIEADFPSEQMSPALAAWRGGKIDEPPLGLAGLQAHYSAEDTVASVLVLSDGRATRMLGIGRALIAQIPGLITIEAAARKHGRIDSLVATLALAGHVGLLDEELFLRVYGFRYAARVHRDVFSVAVHRARTRLGSHAEIRVVDGRHVLQVAYPLLLPDPRCTSSVDERILLVVAGHNRSSARGVAEQLDMPLRTAQASLKHLVEEGICTVKRDGRNIEYRVEDTTFEEPTRSRQRTR